MNKQRWWSFLSPLAALGAIAFFLAPLPSEAVLEAKAVVKLYSAGKQVAQWEALDTGEMDGDLLVFHVKDGNERREVRIRGEFSVEEIR